MKICLIAVLFGALALFAMPAFAQTAFPPGENVDQVISGQDMEKSFHALEIGYNDSASSGDQFNLLEFPAELNGDKMSLSERPYGVGATAYLGGVACMSCAKPGTMPG